VTASPFSPGNFNGLRALKCMPKHEPEDRARAERIFKARQEQKADASQATADYYAAQQRLLERTQELRRLRLAQSQKKQSGQANARKASAG